MEQTKVADFSQLIASMTLDEKIGMIHGSQLFRTAGISRLGIPPLTFSDGTMGVRQEFLPDSWEILERNDDYVTYLPCAAALAASWNRELAEQTGSVLGEEARGRGKDVILSPGMNLKRSPLCGRNFEYFSEDPYLTGQMAVPYIKGIQKWDVAACTKHFAANNQETDRLQVEAEVDEEVLRTLYLPAFRAALMEGGAYTVMGAYNRLYGEYCCQSDFLLNQILRKEWGYDGVVVSDWGAVHDTRKAALSQLDIEMSVTSDFDRYFMAEPLKEAVLAGEIPESVIDEKVGHILLLMERLHMLDGKRKAGTYNTPEHRRVALEAARESVVLLKNEDNTLPIRPETLNRVLVIGENADLRHGNGGGSAEVKTLYEITPLAGIRSLLGGNVRVDYVKGYAGGETKQAGERNWQETSLENGGGTTGTAESVQADPEQEKRLEEALKAAADPSYDRVIFIGGLSHLQDSEGNDRPDMKLPFGQDRLISELLSARPDMTVVLIGGSPVEMEAWADRAKSLVWGWYAGMEGGTALAEVLFGRVNPSGKLPESFYRTYLDCSAHVLGEFPGGKTVRYGEGVLVGYRYLDAAGKEPRFCFGHGLSYSTFSYGPLKAERQENGWRISCQVKNTSAIRGKETVQLYAAPLKPGKGRPVQELKGFVKLDLEAGQEGEAVMVLGEGELSVPCELRAGSSSRDIRSRAELTA